MDEGEFRRVAGAFRTFHKRFARWLYQQGRISEGDRDDDASW